MLPPTSGYVIADRSPVTGRIDDLPTLRRTMRGQEFTVETSHQGQLTLVACGVAYAALGVLGVRVDRTVAWLIIWPAMAFLILSLAAGLHETVHHHLFASARARRVYQAIGSALALVPMGTYPPYHLGHHVHVDSDLDPEGLHRVRNRLEYLLGIALVGPFFFGQLWWAGCRSWTRHPVRYMRRREHIRNARVDSAIAAIGVISCIGGSTMSRTVLDVWAIPVALFVTVVIFFFLAPEHLDETGRSVAGLPANEAARTTVSNPLVRFVAMGLNFHGVHHAWPEVPGPNLAEADAIFAPTQPPQWRSPGYLTWHAKTFRRLSWVR